VKTIEELGRELDRELYANRLANAIMRMAERCARSERKSAHAFNRYLYNNNAADAAEQARYNAATDRQYLALQRLVDALRDLAGGCGMTTLTKQTRVQLQQLVDQPEPVDPEALPPGEVYEREDPEEVAWPAPAGGVSGFAVGRGSRRTGGGS